MDISDLKNLATKFDSQLFIKVLLFISIPALVIILFPAPYGFDYKYEIGSVWLYDDVVAPFPFPVYKDEKEYAKEIADIYAHALYVFDPDTTVYQNQKKEFNSFINTLKTYLDLKKNYLLKKSQMKNLKSLEADSLEIEQLKNVLVFKLSDEKLSQLENFYQLGYLEIPKLKSLGETFLSLVYQKSGVISIPRSSLKRSEIIVRSGKYEEIQRSDKFYDFDECRKMALSLVRENFQTEGVNEEVVGFVAELLLAFVKPNLTFNEAETNALIEREKSKVVRTIGIVRENEKIISKHEIVTPEVHLKLESLKKAQKERGIGVGKYTRDIGRLIFVSAVMMIFWIYLYMFRKRLFFNTKLLMLLTAIFIVEILIASLLYRIKVNLPLTYLVLVPTASMLMTIIFDSRVAFWGTVSLSVIVGSLFGYDYELTAVSFIAGAVSIYSLRNIGNRAQIFRSFIFMFFAYLFVVASFSLQKYESFTLFLAKLGFATANSLLSPILTYGLLIFFERMFGIMTELTLLELSDFNHPLLRELSTRAPGTFHHSVIVATLAESAAKAIGANHVLARVGAYYHDVGKIFSPEFFVENQANSKSLHEEISPEQSVQIIISHVERGQEIARKYHLPSEIIKFIPMHHGTTLVVYFYGKALKRKELQNVDIKEVNFRYRGPKPDSKETAIVMLADSVEAAVRSLDEKTPENIEKMVEAIFESRIEDGQLDDSNLTFKDIEAIKQVFVQKLLNLYHPRVKYPEQETKLSEVERKETTRKRAPKKAK